MTPKATSFVAISLEVAGDYGEALVDLTVAAEINPYNDGILIARGDAYRFTNQFEMANADYTRVLELVPNDQRALASRADAYLRLQEIELGLADLKAYVADAGEANVDPAVLTLITELEAIIEAEDE